MLCASQLSHSCKRHWLSNGTCCQFTRRTKVFVIDWQALLSRAHFIGQRVSALYFRHFITSPEQRDQFICVRAAANVLDLARSAPCANTRFFHRNKTGYGNGYFNNEWFPYKSHFTMCRGRWRHKWRSGRRERTAGETAIQKMGGARQDETIESERAREKKTPCSQQCAGKLTQESTVLRSTESAKTFQNRSPASSHRLYCRPQWMPANCKYYGVHYDSSHWSDVLRPSYLRGF